MRSFFAELRRRNVLRAGALYAAAGWLLVQIATQGFPFYDVPNWAVRWVVTAVIVGLPFVPAFAWFYEITPEGLKCDSEFLRDFGFVDLWDKYGAPDGCQCKAPRDYVCE